MSREMVYILALMVGLIVGFLLGRFFGKVKVVGNFVINHVNPTKDLCTLELKSDIDDIESIKYMTLLVKVIEE